MAGHSKWANIKRRKAAVDAVRGKVFTRVAKEIITAARQGGGDPDANARLRTAIAAAKAVNMPNANIEKAIKRGTGEIEGVQYEEITYEGYGPGGAALFLDVMTDNRNRTVSEIRHLLSRHNGSLGENGCVAWMFEQKGNITIPAKGLDEEQVMDLVVDVGAEDFTAEGDGELWQIVTAPSELFAVREALEGAAAQSMLKLMSSLEDHDDVQRVSANFDIPDDVLAAFEG